MISTLGSPVGALKAEEIRAAKKIEETRKRAVEILALKKRNLKAREDSKMFEQRRQQEASENKTRATKQREAGALRVQVCACMTGFAMR